MEESEWNLQKKIERLFFASSLTSSTFNARRASYTYLAQSIFKVSLEENIVGHSEHFQAFAGEQSFR